MKRVSFFLFLFFGIVCELYAQAYYTPESIERMKEYIKTGNVLEVQKMLLENPGLMQISFPENNQPGMSGGTRPDDENENRWLPILHIIAKYNQPAIFHGLQSLKMSPESERFVHLLASGMTYDEDMNTPVHIAAQFGSLEFIQATHYGIFDSKNKFGETPLFLLAKNKEIDARGIATAKYLLSIGANPEIKNYEGVRLLQIVQNEELKKIIQEKIREK